MTIYYQWIGFTIYIIGGLTLTAFIIGLMLNYIWKKMRDAYSLARLIKVWHKHGLNEPDNKQG